MVFFNYGGGSVEMAAASIDPRWLNKTMLRAVFSYPFLQLGCNRITTRVRADNSHSIRITERLGLIREGTMRQALDGVDVHVYGMLKNECRWINGQKINAEGA